MYIKEHYLECFFVVCLQLLLKFYTNNIFRKLKKFLFKLHSYIAPLNFLHLEPVNSLLKLT